MQAVGMVNDHLVACPCYAEIGAEQANVEGKLLLLQRSATMA
jgi:DNA-3-methyladenine glycosylase I